MYMVFWGENCKSHGLDFKEFRPSVAEGKVTLLILKHKEIVGLRAVTEVHFLI